MGGVAQLWEFLAHPKQNTQGGFENMRNLKKLLAVVVAVALVLTSMTAAFAATNPQADAIAALKLMQGNNGDMMLEQDLARDQAVKIIITLTGKAAEVEALTAADVDAAFEGFADATEAKASWSAKWYAYAIKNGIIQGYTNADGEKITDFAGKLYGKQFATMLLKAFGYKNADYATSVTKLSELEGSKVVDEKGDDSLTRADAIAYLFGALTAKDANGKTVVETYVGSDAALLKAAQDAGLIAPAAALDVASIKADNLRELVVTFNKAPNADEAKKVANYTINGSSPEAATLSADGLTVTLRTSNANKMGNYATDVKLKIKKEVGLSADKEITGIAVKDITPPSAVSVQATGPKTIKVTLSEPLDESLLTSNAFDSSIKVDGGLVGIDTSSTTVSGVSLTIYLYSTLAEGDHKVEFVSGTNQKFADNAGYGFQASTIAFKYVKDTSPLSFTLVKSSETSVTIKFNKALKVGSFAGNTSAYVTHTYNTSNNLVSGSAIATTDNQEFTITFDMPLPPGTTTVYIKYKDGAADSAKIQDDYGNILAPTSFTVNTAADLTKPTATVEFVDAQKIKVTYSEDVKTGGGANAADYIYNYELKADKDVIAINSVTRDDANQSKVFFINTAANALKGGSYTLTIKKVQDKAVANNEIDTVTITFTGTDKVAPYVVDKDDADQWTDVKQIGDNKVKIEFSEAMDASSIANKVNYKYATSGSVNYLNLGDNDSIEVVDSNKAVIITFEKKLSEMGATTGNKWTDMEILVGVVKDAAGNPTANFTTYCYVLSKADIAIKEYQLTGKNAVTIVIEDVISGTNRSDFRYTTSGGISGTWLAPNSVEISVADGKTYIKLITNDITTTTGGGVAIKTVDKDGVNGTSANTKNAYGAYLNIAPVDSAVDKCAPALVSKTMTDQKAGKDNSRTLNTVTLTYSEALYAASIQDSDYTIDGYTVDSVQVNGAVVTITVSKLDYGNLRTGTEIKVKQVGEIMDSAKNVLGAQDAWTITY